MDRFKGLKKVIFYGLLFNIAAVTLLFSTKHQNIIIIKPAINIVIISGLFLLFLACKITRGDFKLHYTPLNVPIILRLLYFAFSALFITAPIFLPYALEETAHFTAYFLTIILIVFSVDTPKKLFLFLRVFFIFYALTVIYGILQLLYIDFIDWGVGGVFTSTFGSKNFFSDYLVMIMFVYFGYMLQTKNKTEKFLCLIFNLTAVFLVYRAFNRSALWIGMPIGFIVFIILQFKFGKLKRIVNSLKKLLIFIAALTVLIGSVWIGIGERGQNSFYSLLHPTGGWTNRVRIVMWTGSLKLAAENPLFGQGIGTTQLNFGRGRPPWYHRYGVSHNTRHVHNEFMEVILEEGLVGLSLFLMFLFVYFYDAVKHIKNGYYTNLITGFIAAVCAFLGANLFSVSSRWYAPAPNFYYIIGLSLAACAIASAAKNKTLLFDGEENEWNQNSVSLSESAVCLRALQKSENETVPENTGYQNARGETISGASREFYLNSRASVDRGYDFQGGEKSNNNTSSPLKTYFSSALYFVFLCVWVLIIIISWRAAASEKFLKKGEMFLNSAHGHENTVMLDNAEKMFNEAIRLNPYELSTYYKLGYIYLEKDDLDGALNQYNHLIKNLAPNYAQIHSNTGVIYLQMGKQKEAIYEFEWATRLESNVNNHERLMISYLNKGNLNKAYSHALYIPYISYDIYLDNLRFKKKGEVWSKYALKSQKERTQEEMKNYSYAYSQMAKIMKERDEHKKSKAYFELSLIWDELNPETLFIKGEDYKNKGDDEKAYEYFKKIILETDEKNIRRPQMRHYKQYIGIIINHFVKMIRENEELWRDPEFLTIFAKARVKYGDNRKAREIFNHLKWVVISEDELKELEKKIFQ